MSSGDTPRYTRADFERFRARVCNWGRWGAEDEHGTLNHLGPAQVRAGAACVRTGQTFSLQLPMDEAGPQTGFGGRSNPVHRMTVTGADYLAWQAEHAAENPFAVGFSDDSLFTFLQAGTQWDALSHVFEDGRMYNGRPANLVTAQGAERAGGLPGDGLPGRETGEPGGETEMKFASVEVPDRAGSPYLGLVADGFVHRVPGDFADVSQALAAGADLHELGAGAGAQPGIALTELRVHAPLRPPAMRDGMSFFEHIRNCQGGTLADGYRERPVFYITNHNAVVGPYDPVAVPPSCRGFDFELEVGAVLGRDVVNPSPAEAAQAIAGYTVFIDWSARDLQGEEMKLGLGPAKGKDSATTLGPLFVTADELVPRAAGKGFDVGMRVWLNGEQITDGNWSSIDWGFDDVVAYAARGTTLSAGEVIGSGTVGRGCLLEHFTIKSEVFSGWLKPGDVVETEVEGLGRTRQEIVPGMPVRPLSNGN